MFVLYDVVDGVGYYNLITLVRRERLIPILTVLKLEDAEGEVVEHLRSHCFIVDASAVVLESDNPLTTV